MKWFKNLILMFVAVVVLQSTSFAHQPGGPDPNRTYTCAEIQTSLDALKPIIDAKIAEILAKQSAIDRAEDFIWLMQAQIDSYLMMGQWPPANLWAAINVSEQNLITLRAEKVTLENNLQYLFGIQVAWETLFAAQQC